MRTLDETIAAILEPPKGMLVLDEYAEALVPSGRFTEAVLRVEGLTEYISAVLLTEAAFATVRPGSEPLVGVRITTPETDLAELARNGASFVEWRENLSPLDVPRGGVHVAVEALARGAAAAQAEGILPVLTIAMPELGASSIQVNQAATTNALLALHDELDRTGVDPRQLLVRINMVVPGVSNPVRADSDDVARRTLGLLEKGVPAQTPGVLLLSGGQPLDQACTYLSAVASDTSHPWRVTFAFSRPLIAAAAEAWAQDGEWEGVLLQSCRRASESVALVSHGAAS